MENNKNHKSACNFFLDYHSQSFLEVEKPRWNLTHRKNIRKRKILENYFINHGFLISGIFDASISRYSAGSLLPIILKKSGLENAQVTYRLVYVIFIRTFESVSKIGMIFLIPIPSQNKIQIEMLIQYRLIFNSRFRIKGWSLTTP